MIKSVSFFAAVALAAVAPAGTATIVTLFSTGVNSSGAVVTGNRPDSHWLINGGGTTYTGQTRRVS